MEALNFPAFEVQLRQEREQQFIYDVLRRKYVVLTPEEWVRQHLLHYLHAHLAYPLSLMSLEKGTSYNRLRKRTDLCVYGRDGAPLLLAECKAPNVPINAAVVKQVSTYNQTLQAPFLLITNGKVHYCWSVDFRKKTFQPLAGIPGWQELSKRF